MDSYEFEAMALTEMYYENQRYEDEQEQLEAEREEENEYYC